MRGHDRVDDRQAQTGALDGALLGRGGAEELGEQVSLLGCRDADAGVADLEHGVVTVQGEPAHDAAPVGGELHRVAEQVHHHPVQVARVP